MREFHGMVECKTGVSNKKEQKLVGVRDDADHYELKMEGLDLQPSSWCIRDVQ